LERKLHSQLWSTACVVQSSTHASTASTARSGISSVKSRSHEVTKSQSSCAGWSLTWSTTPKPLLVTNQSLDRFNNDGINYQVKYLLSRHSPFPCSIVLFIIHPGLFFVLDVLV
jgi:hypothetical protein